MSASTLQVTIAWHTQSSAPDAKGEIALQVKLGCTIADVLELVLREKTQHQSLIDCIANAAAVGIWGKVKPHHTVLREADRVELYDSLKADPKEARRQRVDTQERKYAK